MEKTTFESGPTIKGMDKRKLYEVRTFTDGEAGSILEHRPIYQAGHPIYIAQTFLTFSGGKRLDVKVPLKAETLTDALEEFPTAISAAAVEIEHQMAQQALTKGVSLALNGSPK